MRQHLKALSILLFSLLIAALFQNCSDDFNPAEYGITDSNSITPCGQTSAEVQACLPASGAPKIIVRPADLSIGVGQQLSLSVTSVGANLSYQWFKNDMQIPAQSTNNLVIPNVQLTDAATYAVVVSNSAGTDRANIKVSVIQPPLVGPPVLIQGPANVLVYVNNDVITRSTDVSFTVTAGGESLTYQWYFKGSDGIERALISATATIYTVNIIDLSEANAGTYRVVIKNSGGEISASATLTFRWIITYPPRIQP